MPSHWLLTLHIPSSPSSELTANKTKEISADNYGGGGGGGGYDRRDNHGGGGGGGGYNNRDNNYGKRRGMKKSQE